MYGHVTYLIHSDSTMNEQPVNRQHGIYNHLLLGLSPAVGLPSSLVGAHLQVWTAHKVSNIFLPHQQDMWSALRPIAGASQ